MGGLLGGRIRRYDLSPADGGTLVLVNRFGRVPARPR
jgi:hypothetical protein